MIDLQELKEMFASIASGSNWDMTKPMLWGYFFTDRSHEKLGALRVFLELEGFRFVDLYVPDLDDKQNSYFFLHVEKEEIHTPLTLHHRNTLFYALAERFEIESYDGMDVGPLQH